jgi:hypothetical protein
LRHVSLSARRPALSSQRIDQCGGTLVALDLGLIANDGKQEGGEAMRRTVVAALDRAVTTVVTGSRLRPIRIFAPTR